MNFLIRISFLFCIGSTFGWIIELIFRRFFSSGNKEKHWINPGFLCGPYVPLYGFGLCILYLLAGLEHKMQLNGFAGKTVLFIIMAMCMTVIEYLAGSIFIKGMKVKLWDYSDMPHNYRGIICPQFSLCWAALGALYYFLLHRPLIYLLDPLPKDFASASPIIAYLVILAIDFIYSCKLLSKITNFAMEHNVVVKYDRLRAIVYERMVENEKTPAFFLYFRLSNAISRHLDKYLDRIKEQVNSAGSALEKTKEKNNRD